MVAVKARRTIMPVCRTIQKLHLVVSPLSGFHSNKQRLRWKLGHCEKAFDPAPCGFFTFLALSRAPAGVVNLLISWGSTSLATPYGKRFGMLRATIIF